MAPSSKARPGSNGWRWVRTAAAVLVFVGIAAWLTHDTWEHISPTRQDVGFLTDFRDAVYYPVVALRDGVNPYDATAYYRAYPVGQEFPLYSPVDLVVHLPLATLSLAQARAAYFGLNLALVVVLAAVALRLAGYRSRLDAVFGLAALLLLSDPGRWNLRTGEPTLLIVLGCYLALAASARHAGRAALGLAVTLAKPTFGLPLAIVLLARRRVRATMIGIGVAGAISLLVAIPLAQSAGGIGNLFDSLRSDLDVTSRSFQSRLGTPLRLDAGNTLARATGLRPSEAVAGLVGLALLGVGAWAVWLVHTRHPESDRGELAVTLACLVMLVPLFRVTYDLLLLTWPILLLLRRRPEPTAIEPRVVRTVLVVVLLLPMVDPMGWSFVRAVLGGHGLAEHLLGPTASGFCLLAGFVMCCALAFRPVRAPRVVAS